MRLIPLLISFLIKVLAMRFKDVYQFLVAKATKKNRTKQEVDEIICWLTVTR